MSGRILIVSDVPTNRIVLKVKLAAACYDVVACGSDEDIVETALRVRPRLILLDCDGSGEAAVRACAMIRAQATLAAMPIIAISSVAGSVAKQAQMLATLDAGADAFQSKPVDEAELLARIRNLVRVREISDELRLRDSTSRALGFAEGADDFARPARIALVAGDEATARGWRDALDGRVQHRISILDRQAVLNDAAPALQDIYVIAADLSQGGDGLKLMSELRSRRWSRHASVVIVLPQIDPARAAMALDLGASDLIGEPVDGREMAVRLRGLVARKRESDRLRRRVRDGLKLAVTDPLTGLFNRRYALSHLARIQDRAVTSGQNFAVMVLDLDRFKRVNDTYGHAAGDSVLREVAKRLTGNLRSVDLVARIGGEEFLVAMPDTTVEEARNTALRLCRLIECEPIALPAPGSGSIRQTVSIGVALGGCDGSATAHPGSGKPADESLLDALIDRADQALLASKSQGRNKVTLGRDAA